MDRSAPAPSGNPPAVLPVPWQRRPTIGTQLLNALRRYPERLAFKWEGGSLSYRATAELIGRMQAVYAGAGLQRGARVALLSSNLAAGWAAGQAALCSGMAITWLHPMGSLEDQLFQLDDFQADALVVDAGAHGKRGEALASADASLPPQRQLKAIYSVGPAAFGSRASARPADFCAVATR